MERILITAEKDGRKVKRICYGDYQAFTISNQLCRDGCRNIGMRELKDGDPDAGRDW